MNDKTIVQFDSFVNNLRSEELFTKFKFQTKQIDLTEDGSHELKEYEHSGAYLICDGGYHRWRCLQAPIAHAYVYSEVRWSKWLESVRKDVECTFGIMKKRFSLLKYGYRFNKKSQCDNVFKVCCILHNMLLHEDHLDDKWDNDDENDEMDEEELTHIRKFRCRLARDEALRDKSLVGNYYFNAQVRLDTSAPTNTEVRLTDLDYFNFKQYLIVHFKYLFDTNQVTWLS
jgi:hypothetical protein